MAGIVSMVARDPELAAAAHAALVEPRAAASRIVSSARSRAATIPADADVETLCVIGPAMMSYRALMLGLPVNREFSIRVIDGVVLPAAHGVPSSQT